MLSARSEIGYRLGNAPRVPITYAMPLLVLVQNLYCIMTVIYRVIVVVSICHCTTYREEV